LWLSRHKMKLKYDIRNLVLGGGLSGFLAGIIGTGGPVRGVVLHAFGFDKHKFIATAAVGAIAADMVRIPVYMQKGFLEIGLKWYIPVLFVMSICGTYVGKMVVDRISKKQFSAVVVTALFVIGAKFIYDWLL